jgi:uncharacterized membrane protein
MDTYTLVKVVLVMVLCIGGVAMVSTVILPAVKKMVSGEERKNTFEKIEGRFALQAKITKLLTGLGGFYMIYHVNGWERFSFPLLLSLITIIGMNRQYDAQLLKNLNFLV